MDSPTRPYDVMDVAREVIKNYRDFFRAKAANKTSDNAKPLTFSKEKLVMILYYIQGYAMQQNGIPMFRDPMVALSTVYLDIESSEFQKEFHEFGYMREDLSVAMMEMHTKLLAGYNPEAISASDRQMIFDVCRGFIPHYALNIFGALLVNELTFQNGVAHTLCNYENHQPAAAIDLKMLGAEFKLRSEKRKARTDYLLKQKRA